MLPGSRVVQPAGIEQRHDASHVEHSGEGLAAQNLQQPRRMAQPRGLHDHPIGTVTVQQVDQGRLHHEGQLAAEAAAGNPLDHQVIPGLEHRLVNAHLAELIDQDGPALIRGLLLDQPVDQGALAAAEKAGDQVDGHVGQGGGHGESSGMGISVIS